MKFSLFINLLEFVPEKTRLVHKGMFLGEYDGKEMFWHDEEVQEMKVNVKEVNHYNKTVVLEVL